jgi:hypothetical protein
MLKEHGRIRQSGGRQALGPPVRVVGGSVAVGAAVALLAGVGSASAVPSVDQPPHKSYVCKYVSKPGEAERLQTGQNPIWVDNHSLLGYDGTVTVGQQFKDGQIRSVVIVANTKKLNPEPTVADCPPPTPPPTKPTTPPTKPTTPPPTKPTTPPPTKPTTPPTKPTTHPTTETKTQATGTATGAIRPTAKPQASVYELAPVNGGTTAAGTSEDDGVRPGQAALALAGLLGLGIAIGVRRPRVTRPERPRGDE